MKYKAILVDDEDHCLRTMETQLGWIDVEVEVLLKANSVREAKAFLSSNEHHLDFIFLDINMPEADGFQLLDDPSLEKVHVVFVTAFDEFALQAFQYHASGYLTKPVSTDELEALLESLIKRKSVETTGHLKLNTREGIEIIDLNNILYIEADGSYAHFILKNDRKLIASKNLKNVNLLLPETGFLRIHSKYIVNTQYIKSLSSGSSPKLTLAKEYELPVSRSRKEEVLKLIHQL